MAKRFFFAGLSLVMSVLISLSCAEAYFRFFPPAALQHRSEAQAYFGMMRYDPEIGRLFRPDYSGDIMMGNSSFHVATNSLGLRGPEPKKSADYRILFLGDSFTFGYGVEEHVAFPARVREAIPEGFDVINAGVSGWGPSQESRFLKKVGLGLQPDLIILGFYMNDIKDMYITDLQHADDSLLIWQTKQASRLLRQRWWEKSYAFTALKAGFSKLATKTQDAFLKKTNRVELGSREAADDEPWTVPPGGITVVDLASTLPFDVEVESWSGVSLSDNEVQLKIWRRAVSGAFDLVGESGTKNVRAGSFEISLDRPIQAKAGDFVGFFASNGNIARLTPLRGNKVYQLGKSESLQVGKMVADRAGSYAVTIVGKVTGRASDPRQVVDERQFNNLVAGTRVVGSVATNELAIYQWPYQPDTQTSIDLALQRIAEMAAMARGIGAQFAVAYLPSYIDTEKMEAKLLTEMRATRDELNLSSDRFRQNFVSRVKDQGIPVVDLTDVFRNSNQENLYLSDTHFNAAGHALTAAVLVDYIRPILSARAKGG